MWAQNSDPEAQRSKSSRRDAELASTPTMPFPGTEWEGLEKESSFPPWDSMEEPRRTCPHSRRTPLAHTPTVEVFSPLLEHPGRWFRGGEMGKMEAGSHEKQATRCSSTFSLLQGLSVTLPGMQRGQEIRSGPIHRAELSREGVLPQLLLCQHAIFLPILQVPRLPGLPQVHPKQVHLVWTKVSADLTLACSALPLT